jgi:hypothetical protein
VGCDSGDATEGGGTREEGRTDAERSEDEGDITDPKRPLKRVRLLLPQVGRDDGGEQPMDLDSSADGEGGYPIGSEPTSLSQSRTAASNTSLSSLQLPPNANSLSAQPQVPKYSWAKVLSNVGFRNWDAVRLTPAALSAFWYSPPNLMQQLSEDCADHGDESLRLLTARVRAIEEKLLDGLAKGDKYAASAFELGIRDRNVDRPWLFDFFIVCIWDRIAHARQYKKTSLPPPHPIQVPQTPYKPPADNLSTFRKYTSDAATILKRFIMSYAGATCDYTGMEHSHLTLSLKDDARAFSSLKDGFLNGIKAQQFGKNMIGLCLAAICLRGILQVCAASVGLETVLTFFLKDLADPSLLQKYPKSTLMERIKYVPKSSASLIIAHEIHSLRDKPGPMSFEFNQYGDAELLRALAVAVTVSPIVLLGNVSFTRTAQFRSGLDILIPHLSSPLAPHDDFLVEREADLWVLLSDMAVQGMGAFARLIGPHMGDWRRNIDDYESHSSSGSAIPRTAMTEDEWVLALQRVQAASPLPTMASDGIKAALSESISDPSSASASWLKNLTSGVLDIPIGALPINLQPESCGSNSPETDDEDSAGLVEEPEDTGGAAAETEGGGGTVATASEVSVGMLGVARQAESALAIQAKNTVESQASGSRRNPPAAVEGEQLLEGRTLRPRTEKQAVGSMSGTQASGSTGKKRRATTKLQEPVIPSSMPGTEVQRVFGLARLKDKPVTKPPVWF